MQMHSIERGQLGVMRAHAAIFAVVALIAASIAGVALATATPLPGWLPPLGVALLLVWPVLIAPGRNWRAWGWHADARELTVKRGVWTEVVTHVPFERVQHLDVAQGPIERAFGVTRLQLHTAGTAHSLVTLPGLDRATAEQLRDEIREHIRAGSA